jgi:hypothetical protein
MKQGLVIGAVAFLAATGGGTYYALKLAPSPRPLPKPLDLSFHPRTREKADSDSVATPDSTAKPDSGKAKPPRAAAVVPTGPDTATAARFKKLAKIILAMKTKEALVIMNPLSDEELEMLFAQLKPKQIAEYLAALPNDRAVRMSRRMLEAKHERKGGH